MLRGLGNIAKLMGSMGEIQSRMEAMKQTLSELKVEGAAGGIVPAVVNAEVGK